MAESDTLRAIEVYREEHTTWNMPRMMSVFADDAKLFRAGVAPLEGKEVLRKQFDEWKSGQKDLLMKHLRVIVSGNQAAVEWESTGTWADGSPILMTGANIYEVENGKIKYLHIYRDT